MPRVKSTKECLSEKLIDLAEEAAPIAEQKKKDVSKFVLDKYSEAVNLTKKAEEKRKKDRMKAIRNTIIATTLGFSAGAATGYVLVKKSQIKDSDYVFTDDTVAESLPANNTPTVESTGFTETQTKNPQKKDFKDFDDTYQISIDGTTLIKK